MQIFELNMRKYDYLFAEGAKERLQRYFEEAVVRKDANFGNGRLARNVFEKTIFFVLTIALYVVYSIEGLFRG